MQPHFASGQLPGFQCNPGSFGYFSPSHPDLHPISRSGWLLGSGSTCPMVIAAIGLGFVPYLETRPMFQDFSQGAGASNVPPVCPVLPEYPQEPVNHTLFGSLTAVGNTIKLLHKLGYAEPNDWSKPLPTGRVNEVMAILTRRVRVD